MKKILFVINDYAEVGKTTFSAALTTFLRDQGHQCGYLAIVGEDSSSESLNGYYDGVWDVVEQNDSQHLFDWSERFDVLVCDVQSGNSGGLFDLFESSDIFLDLGDIDTEVTVITPDVEEEDCHQEIADIAEHFSDHVYYIVPRIPIDEFRSSLQAWEDSEACQVMDYLGAEVIEVPRLTDAMQELIESLELTTVDAMILSEDELPVEAVPTMKRWRRDFERQLEECLEYLLPAQSARGQRLSA